MSVLLEYLSKQPVSSEAAEKIKIDQLKLLKDRRYWSEPLFVGLEHAAPAKLVGSNSLFNSGGYETQSGEWIDVSEHEDYLMAWSDTNFIVQKLASWSKEHGIDWIVYSAGDHIGDVVQGNPSKNLEEFIEGLLEASTLSPGMVSEVDTKFQSRCEEPQQIATHNIWSGAASIKLGVKKPWWRFW